MKFEDHCKESIELFGAPFEQVHLWLDEFAGTPEYGMRHRKVRHHQAGLRQLRALIERGKAPFDELKTEFSADVIVEVARRHMISDFKEEGWSERDPFPEDERHYVKMGLF
ncbi:MAG: hypothetical protein KDK38_09320 [Leptospiraceae bacterium]|nr:hypothetical protein [Leptospiraceae bacterium]